MGRGYKTAENEMTEIRQEMKRKVLNWVIKVYTESTKITYLYKFPTEENDRERYGDYGDYEWWQALEELADEGWVARVEGPMNQVDYRWGERLTRTCRRAALENSSPICPEHNSVMTFGRYSSHPIYEDAHTEFKGHTYYCNECVDELVPIYQRYRAQYK